MKNSLTIGIDIDGTLTEAYDWLVYANQYFGKNLKEEEITCYEIHEAMEIARVDYLSFYHTFKYLLHANNQPRNRADWILQRLSKDHVCQYITARGEDLRHTTETWLSKHGFPNLPLYMLDSHEKVNLAKSLGCDLFIEDRLETAQAMARAKIPTLLVDTHYNRGPLDPLITRVTSWSDIDRHLSALSLVSA